MNFESPITLKVGCEYETRGNRKFAPEIKKIVSYNPLGLYKFFDESGEGYMTDGRFLSNTKTRFDLVKKSN